MDLKPSVFIGSSKEGYKIAETIASLLEDSVSTHLWKEAFEYGVSTYDNLSSKIALYDYAILIATPDDTIISRHKKSTSPRDNILFEFGLFAGGLGSSKVFYIVQENTKIPTDLSGITLLFISGKDEIELGQAIEKTVVKIKKYILDKEDTYDLSFLPSTVLAYGYFSNFVERTIERLLEDKKDEKIFHLENGKAFSIVNLKVTILLPNDLTDDMFKKVKAKRLKDGWHKLKVDPKDVRDYDFSIDISFINNGLLHLIDIPYTLNALNLAIDLYSRKAHLGKTEKERLLEQREIRNFKRTLEYLIKRSSITKGLVNVEIVDI